MSNIEKSLKILGIDNSNVNSIELKMPADRPIHVVVSINLESDQVEQIAKLIKPE